MTRPRAADDFAVIRTRLEELRRERAQASTEQEGRSVNGPRQEASGRRFDPIGAALISI
jgi:hypothetical protein